MILLDTHIWLWWVLEPTRLTQRQLEAISKAENDKILISAISCWEISKLHEYGRIQLPLPLLVWLNTALSYPGIQLLELTPEIAAQSASLPDNFHKDPADQIIVASSRISDVALVTSDSKILAYKHVRTIH